MIYQYYVKKIYIVFKLCIMIQQNLFVSSRQYINNIEIFYLKKI